MRRFTAALLLGMLILAIGSIWVYHNYEKKIGSVGPVFLQPCKHYGYCEELEMYTPTRSLVEASCTGTGNLEVYSFMTGRLVSNKSVYGHFAYQFVLPHEGEYMVANTGNGNLTCAFRFVRNYPTRGVQNAVYGSGTAFAILLALLLWRWRR